MLIYFQDPVNQYCCLDIFVIDIWGIKSDMTTFSVFVWDMERKSLQWYGGGWVYLKGKSSNPVKFLFLSCLHSQFRLTFTLIHFNLLSNSKKFSIRIANVIRSFFRYYFFLLLFALVYSHDFYVTQKLSFDYKISIQ